MRLFEKTINGRKSLSVHKDNKFNKQFSVLLKDWHYLEIIVDRIDTANSDNATQLNLDLKSLYVFGRVYSESLIYIASLFVVSSSKIDWTKIGVFVKNATDNLNSEPSEFVKFWSINKGAILNLFNTFKYRNYVLHEKDSDTEWTFAWPGKSNLDYVFISNVPWSEDSDSKKKKKSLNTRNLIQILNTQSLLIFDYLESIEK